MPRTARLVIPGYLYHVTQRGNFRQNVFDEDQDRVVYLKYTNENCKKYDLKVYAYCLMDNHVHWIVEPGREESLAEVFKASHVKYSHYFNRKRNQKGHLWQGRFYSCMIVGAHVEEVFRYVENNPVRAGMVEKAWAYSWSSARAHLGKKYTVIDLADVRDYLEVKRWKRYLMQKQSEGIIQVIRERTRKGLMLASDEFIEKMERCLGVTIKKKLPGRPKTSVCH